MALSVPTTAAMPARYFTRLSSGTNSRPAPPANRDGIVSDRRASLLVPKLRLGTHGHEALLRWHGNPQERMLQPEASSREAELRGLHSQAELGNEGPAPAANRDECIDFSVRESAHCENAAEFLHAALPS